MLSDKEAIRAYFSKLGLASEIADMYLALYTHGPQTISQLSRAAGVERTRIYRLIDSLLDSHLIEIEADAKRGIIKAAPITNLNILITQKEQELHSLQTELGLIEQVLARNTISSPATRVQFYRGPEGIRQMQWNLLRSDQTILSIMHRPMQDITGSAFFNRWMERWNQGTQPLRILVDEQFLRLSNRWHSAHPDLPAMPKRQEMRLLSPATMPITFATDIYGEVVAYYNWHKDEVFGFEIYNRDIMQAQKHFFELLWRSARPRDTGD